MLWGLPEPAETYSLCEVSVVNAVFLKQTTLRDPTDNLAANLRLLACVNIILTSVSCFSRRDDEEDEEGRDAGGGRE